MMESLVIENWDGPSLASYPLCVVVGKQQVAPLPSSSTRSAQLHEISCGKKSRSVPRPDVTLSKLGEEEGKSGEGEEDPLFRRHCLIITVHTHIHSSSCFGLESCPSKWTICIPKTLFYVVGIR